MKLKMISLFFVLITAISPLFAQQVSTLINDPSREFAAMHWHEDGRIYAVDYFNGRLYQVFLDGSVQTLVSDFANLAGGGFDNEGNFYFAAINQGDICRLNEDNSYTVVASGFNQPVGVLAHPTDNDLMYVTEYGNSKVTKFSLSTGVVTPFVSNNGINGPDAIIFDWSGENFLISNWNNHKIHRLHMDGTVSLFATVPASGTMGYVDRVGDYLYVPSFSGKKLFRINQDGNVELIAGTGTTGHADGDASNATFTRPNGTCHNPAGDTILVSDDHTIRIITDFEPIVNTVEAPLIQSLLLSPNPVSSFLTVTLNMKDGDTLEWEIYDLEGREVKTGIASGTKGADLNFQIPVDELTPATYNIHFGNGLAYERRLFIKME